MTVIGSIFIDGRSFNFLNPKLSLIGFLGFVMPGFTFFGAKHIFCLKKAIKTKANAMTTKIVAKVDTKVTPRFPVFSSPSLSVGLTGPLSSLTMYQPPYPPYFVPQFPGIQAGIVYLFRVVVDLNR